MSYKSSSDSMSTSGEFEIVAEGSATTSAKDDKRKAVGSLPLEPQTATSPESKSGALATSPPTLNIANNGDMMDLEQNLKEMIREIEKSPLDSDAASGEDNIIIIALKESIFSSSSSYCTFALLLYRLE